MKKDLFNPYLILLLILINCNLYAQKYTGIAVYEMNMNFGLPHQEDVILVFNSYESLFFGTHQVIKNLNTINPEKLLDPRIINYYENHKVFFSVKSDTLVATNTYLDEEYVISENKLLINWEITEETKKIDELNCYKAVGEFRGRKYTAWFAPEIPVSFGPFKFNGLPGLIITLNDSENKINFTIKKIILNPPAIENTISSTIKAPTKGTKITLKEFVVLKDKENDILARQTISQQPRESTARIHAVAGRNHKLEKEYEWENTNKK